MEYLYKNNLCGIDRFRSLAKGHATVHSGSPTPTISGIFEVTASLMVFDACMDPPGVVID